MPRLGANLRRPGLNKQAQRIARSAIWSADSSLGEELMYRDTVPQGLHPQSAWRRSAARRPLRKQHLPPRCRTPSLRGNHWTV